MAQPYSAEPYLKISERSAALIRAPRAQKRRMALVLLAALGIFLVPMALVGLFGAAVLVAAIPLGLLFTTFLGANTIWIDETRRRVCVRRHYFLWSRLLLDQHFADVKNVTVQARVQEGHEESPLTPISALAAPLGVHVHFTGSVVHEEGWDLCFELNSGERPVAISSRNRASAEAARDLLTRKFGIGGNGTTGSLIR